jgi:hypothetical protein
MRYSTIQNKRRDALEALRRAYYWAEQCCLPANKLRDRRMEARAYLAGCPRYVLSFFDGYDHALMDRFMERGPETIFAFGFWHEGKFHTYDKGLSGPNIVNPEHGDIGHKEYFDLAKHYQNETNFYYRKDLTKPY